MLKSLFEASIDTLHIPAEMKTAIKNINNICLEAEGDEKDPARQRNQPQAMNFNNPSSYNVFQQQAAPAAQPAKQQTQPPQQQAAPAAQNTEQQTRQPQVPKGATREPGHVRTSGSASQAQKVPQVRKGADVATVQYFLNSSNPNMKLAADGVLGPNTIKAIQATKRINETGKMDNATNEAFNQLLNEAKKKVQAAQSKLGVSQDGLIGKQTLAALNNAKMNVNSIFTGMPAAEKNATQNTKVNNRQTQANTRQPQANAQQQTNLTANQFDEAKAQQALKSNYISQQEYNIWKTYGIAPVYQRQKPQETQAYIAKMQQANNGQPQQAAQPQQQVPKGMTRAPSQVRTSGPASNGQQQVQAQQQAQAQQQQQAPQQQQTQPQQQNPKAPQGSTQYMSGKVSYMNLPPDEKKVYDDAEKKAQAEYIKKGNNEQTAYEKAQMNAQVAVLRYRQKKGNKS